MNGLDLEPRLEGRPRLDLDLVELEKLCALQCTRPEIAAWFVCSLETIDKRIKDTTRLYEVDDSESPGQKINLNFHEIMQRGYARGKISMRRQQIKMLNEGNGTMGVWLGKQYLGQKDIVIHANPDGSPVQTNPINLVIDRLVMLLERRREGAGAERSPQIIDGVAGQPDNLELAELGPDEAAPAWDAGG